MVLGLFSPLKHVLLPVLFVLLVPLSSLAALTSTTEEAVSPVTGRSLKPRSSWDMSLAISDRVGSHGHCVVFLEGYETDRKKQGQSTWLHGVSFGEATLHSEGKKASTRSVVFKFWNRQKALESVEKRGYRVVKTWVIDKGRGNLIQDLIMYHKRQVLQSYSVGTYIDIYFGGLIKTHFAETERDDDFTVNLYTVPEGNLIEILREPEENVVVLVSRNSEGLFLQRSSKPAGASSVFLDEVGSRGIRVTNRGGTPFRQWLLEDVGILAPDWLTSRYRFGGEENENTRLERLGGKFSETDLKLPLYHAYAVTGHNCATYADSLLRHVEDGVYPPKGFITTEGALETLASVAKAVTSNRKDRGPTPKRLERKIEEKYGEKK